MEHSLWPAIKSLFFEAKSLPMHERADFVAAARVGDEVKSEVLSLLAEEAKAEAFMEQPSYALVPNLVASLQRPLPPGTRLGSYELISLLGHGGMGTVYLARHTALNKLFALKTIQQFLVDEPGFSARFKHEAQILGKLNHPSIVNVTDFGTNGPDGTTPYIVMERLTGCDLQGVLHGETKLHPERAINLLRSMADALDYAHGEGVLHRDLKPANVWIVSEEGEQAMLLDFGIAVSDGGPGVGQVMGTPAYMAPELVNGDPTAANRASDLYSLGVMAFQMFTGKLPREEGKGVFSLPEATFGPETKTVFNRMLSPDPLARFPDATTFVDALAEANARMTRRHVARKRWQQTCAWAAVLALLCATSFALLSAKGFFAPWEYTTEDLRYRFLPTQQADPRIALLVLDDNYLDQNPEPLATMSGPMSADLHRVMDAGAKILAVDLLLPESWSRSPEFVSLVLSHHERVVFGALETDERTIGPEAMEGLITAALGEKAASLFGWIMVDKKADGVLRTGRVSFDKETGGVHASLAARAAFLFTGRQPDLASSVFIPDFSIDWRDFSVVPWSELGNVLAHDPGFFEGRLVLAGAEFAGSGDQLHVVPHPSTLPGRLSGLRFQALCIQTLVQQRSVHRMGTFPVAILLLVLMFLLGWPLLAAEQIGRLLVFSLLVILSFTFISWLSLNSFRGLIPVVGPVLLLMVYLGIMIALRPLFSGRTRIE